MKWVVSRIMRPFLLRWIIFHVDRLLYGSMPEVGSVTATRTKQKCVCIMILQKEKEELSYKTRGAKEINQWKGKWGREGIFVPSRITTLLSPISAMPNDSLRFWPPERVLLRALAFSVRPTSASISRAASCTSLLGTPLNDA
jgi:hypothetical protein